MFFRKGIVLPVPYDDMVEQTNAEQFEGFVQPACLVYIRLARRGITARVVVCDNHSAGYIKECLAGNEFGRDMHRLVSPLAEQVLTYNSVGGVQRDYNEVFLHLVFEGSVQQCVNICGVIDFFAS